MTGKVVPMRKRKSWADKLRSAKPHQVKPAPIDIAGMRKGQIMLVPSPQIIDAFIRGIPKGRRMDARTLRDELARAHGAEVTCPITTGILLRMVAEAACEAHEQGVTAAEITPVWRVLAKDAPMLKKLSFGPGFILEQQRAEGCEASGAGDLPRLARCSNAMRIAIRCPTASARAGIRSRARRASRAAPAAPNGRRRRRDGRPASWCRRSRACGRRCQASDRFPNRSCRR